MGAQHWCLLLLTCSLVKCIPQTSETTEPTIVKHQYIISFHDFLPIEEHNTILETYIGNTDSWELIERHNQATEFPSDFALIRITNPENERKLISSLKLNKNIKNIFPQKRYTRSPSAFIDTDILEYPTSFSQLRNNQTCTVDEPNKRNGRQTGKIFMQDEFSNFGTRKLHSAPQVTQLLNADFFWDKGISGKGIRVAIFDTGLSYEHPHFLNIKDLTDWTDEGTLEDYVGHGTFVAGIIASVDQFCSGFAPDSELYIFRVFTNSQASYTSWFLDAFNYAIHCKIDVLNLSIGGPDWKDEPFVEKVWELSANNVIVVSAIGNDGPLFGTLNNPADMMDVLGVGGIDYNDKIASFSSRGMTTWELPLGYGRVKPDIVGYGRSVSGSRFYEGCRTMSGTSVASPVIAGAVTLLISSVPSEYRNNIVNPASIKQVLVETAELVGEAGIFEQGFGKMNMVAAYEALSLYTPRASVIPPALDFTECPYMWPFCVQPTYHTAMPIIFNTTILNGMGVAGFIDHPHWIAGKGGEYLELAFTYSDILWPWTGFLAIHIQVTEEGANYRGTAEGVIQVVVRSPPRLGEVSERITTIEIPVRVQIIPTPHRSKRILWDQYHSLSYPLGFFPNDILWDNSDPFDWNADHLHTNFRTMFEEIQNLGFFVEILGEPFTCFNADNYKILIIADSEENFAPEEQEKLYEDVSNGLSLVVIADWYNTRVMDKISFFDENTDKIWKPFTGGCNLPALNELLGAYDIQFGNGVYNGEVHVNGHSFRYGSGSAIVQFPQGGKVLLARLNDQASSILASGHKMEEVGILGFYSTSNNITPEGGRIAVFGDSSCFDDAMDGPSCRWLLRDLLFYSSALAEPHIDKNTITVTSTNIPDSAIIPERLSDQTESFTRLPEGEILCQSPYFQEPTNFQEDPVEILWQPLMYIQKENPMDALPQPAVTQILQDNIEDYLVPYLVICGCVILIMAFAIRRKTKTTNQKHPAIPSDSNKALV